MTLTTADISIQLLTDLSNSLSEVHDRLTARIDAADHNPTQGPQLRQVLEELLEVMDRCSTDGLI